MDAISSISSRISQIEMHLAAIRTGAGLRGGTVQGRAGTATAGSSFATTYADALASVGATGKTVEAATGKTAEAVTAKAAGAATGNTAGAATVTAAVGTGATKLNARGVPLDLVSYGNGRIPANALHQVGGTRHRLWAPAADSLTKLMADAKRDGVTIGITDSYRPYAEQVDLAKRKGLYSQGGLAAKPGTSEHGWGMATDLNLDSKAQTWMRTNGARYGFVEDTPREPWHWAYRPKAA